MATYDTKVPVDLANPESQNTVDRAAQFLAKNTGWELGARQQAKLGPLDAFVYPLEKIDAGREGR